MVFYLHEIIGGETGQGASLRSAIGDAMLRASRENRLTETILPIGQHELSRPWFPQKVNLAVRTEDEAHLSQLFPFSVLARVGSVALEGHTLHLVILPPPDRPDPTKPFTEPIFAAVDSEAKAENWKVDLYMAITYRNAHVTQND